MFASSRALPSTNLRRALSIFVAAAMLALLALTAAVRSVEAASTLDIDVGYGQGTVAGQAFGPGAPTVLVGDSLRFTITSDEVHTVTFGTPPSGVPLDQFPISGWAAPAGPPPWDFGTVEYDGTGFLNTGIAVTGSTATVTFSAAGSFPFFCAIHPGMDGYVDVVEDGTATTQAEADEASDQTRDELLGQVDSLRQERLDSVEKAENSDGSSTWSVYADALSEPTDMPGGGSGYLELLEFIPDEIDVKEGDMLSWTASSVHTVTFVPEGTDPSTLDPFATPPSGDGSEYDGTQLANSGVFNAGPMSVASFSLTFPNEGTYPFVCLLHAGMGQLGTVMVGDLPPTDVAGGVDPTAPPLASTLPLLLLVGGALGAGVWFFGLRRRVQVQSIRR